ncbi:MAG: YihY/virulence factor BrkB family protein [Candidatus Binatia bacterium]
MFRPPVARFVPGAWASTKVQAAGVIRATRHLATGNFLADLVGLLLLVPVAVMSFVRDRCIQWAAALAYYTLIGLVPLLIVLFSLIKWLGLHRRLTPFIVSTIGAGSPEVSIQIVRFIDRTNMNAVGILSILGALLAVLGILGNAELCFNTIWGGLPGRPWWGKVRAFIGVAVAAPVMLLLALAATTFFRRGTTAWAFFEEFYLGDAVLFVLGISPYALLWVSFTMLYTVLPNRIVRLRSALVGAVVAGSLWQFAQWGYVTFVIKMVRFSAFYGALWQLPILLAWVYVAWSIILFGAEVCRAHQQRHEARVTSRRVVPQTPDTVRVE